MRCSLLQAARLSLSAATNGLRARGTITIPQDVRDALDLAEGISAQQ
jgi:hypothetical protein